MLSFLSLLTVVVLYHYNHNHVFNDVIPWPNNPENYIQSEFAVVWTSLDWKLAVRVGKNTLSSEIIVKVGDSNLNCTS